MFAEEMARQGLSSADDPFLTEHAEQVRGKIADGFLRSLPTQYLV
jgi:hypothetical protein